jgi:hypothetical protein
VEGNQETKTGQKPSPLLKTRSLGKM